MPRSGYNAPPAPRLALCAGLLVGLANGCLDVDGAELQSINVDSAVITSMNVCTIAFIGGTVGAEGSLVIENASGESRSYPVELFGATVGFAFNVGYSNPVVDLVLELPSAELTGDQLLGHYAGSAEAFVAGVGVEARHMENEHGVGIDQPFLGIGVGMMVAFEYMDMALHPDPEGGSNPCIP